MLPASGIPSLLHYISRTHICSAPKKRDYYCTLSGFCQTSIRKETGRNLTTRNLTSKPEGSRNQNANSGVMDPEGSRNQNANSGAMDPEGNRSKLFDPKPFEAIQKAGRSRRISPPWLSVFT